MRVQPIIILLDRSDQVVSLQPNTRSSQESILKLQLISEVSKKIILVQDPPTSLKCTKPSSTCLVTLHTLVHSKEEPSKVVTAARINNELEQAQLKYIVNLRASVKTKAPKASLLMHKKLNSEKEEIISQVHWNKMMKIDRAMVA